MLNNEINLKHIHLTLTGTLISGQCGIWSYGNDGMTPHTLRYLEQEPLHQMQFYVILRAPKNEVFEIRPIHEYTWYFSTILLGFYFLAEKICFSFLRSKTTILFLSLWVLICLSPAKKNPTRSSNSSWNCFGEYWFTFDGNLRMSKSPYYQLKFPT